MLGSILWLAVAGAVAGWEVACRWSAGQRPGLGRIGSWIAIPVVGRVALFGFWAFVGFHLFARYTIPRGWP